MFRLIYASERGETTDIENLRTHGLDGFEIDGDAVSVPGSIGTRCTDLPTAIKFLKNGVAYATWQPTGDWVAAAKQIDTALAGLDEQPGLLMIEPWPDRRTVRELWLFLETVANPRVRIGFPAAWGDSNAQSSDRVVPTLNLRLGLVRVHDSGTTTIDYARRLAGIGFQGYFVIDPPAIKGAEDQSDPAGLECLVAANVSRLDTAAKIARVVREIIQPHASTKPATKKPSAGVAPSRA